MCLYIPHQFGILVQIGRGQFVLYRIRNVQSTWCTITSTHNIGDWSWLDLGVLHCCNLFVHLDFGAAAILTANISAFSYDGTPGLFSANFLTVRNHSKQSRASLCVQSTFVVMYFFCGLVKEGLHKSISKKSANTYLEKFNHFPILTIYVATQSKENVSILFREYSASAAPAHPLFTFEKKNSNTYRCCNQGET